MTDRWSVVVIADGLDQDKREGLFDAIAETCGEFIFAGSLDVSGQPLDEVAALVNDYGNEPASQP